MGGTILGMLIMTSVNIMIDLAVKAATAYLVIYAGRKAWKHTK